MKTPVPGLHRVEREDAGWTGDVQVGEIPTIERLSAHILFWLLITAIAGWFIWSTALTG